MLFVNISFWIILLYFATSSLPGWATKNWLPTLFSENLSIDMSEAGPLSTFTIAISSFIGVIAGGILSDKWIQQECRNGQGKPDGTGINASPYIPLNPFVGAIITKLLGESTDAGNLGHDFAMMASLVFVALVVEVIFLRPRTVKMTDK